MSQYQEIHDLAGSLIERVTQSTESWRAFLNSAAYTYNYSFPNQLLIYHQRPSAKAVATIEYWNKNAQRWVKRGSRGISILDTSANRSRLRYVFDLEDTYARAQIPEALPWQISDSNRDAFFAALQNGHEASSPLELLTNRTAELTAQRRALFFHSLDKHLTDSSLEWRSKENRQHTLEQLVQRRQPSRTPGSNPIGLMQLTLHFEDAHAFQKARNCVVKPSRWHDIDLEVYL